MSDEETTGETQTETETTRHMVEETETREVGQPVADDPDSE